MDKKILLKKRNESLDIIKGIAIILVVFGHCIQFGNGSAFLKSNLFFDDILFKIIYSFHMPLFMLISGYFYFFTISKCTIKELIASRITKFLIPIFVWNGLFCIVQLACQDNKFNIITEIVSYVKSSILSLWFLWAVFFCSIAVMMVNKFFKDNIYVYLLGFILTFVITDYINFSLYKFMYPFFVLGYLYNKNKEGINKNMLFFKGIYLLICVIVIYIVLIFWYNRSSYIYLGGYTLIGKNVMNQVSIDLYRFFIGLVGSATVILLVNYLLKNKVQNSKTWMSKLGEESLGIYIISGYLILFLARVTPNLSINYFMNLLETIIILLGSYSLTKLIKGINIANSILFGGR